MKYITLALLVLAVAIAIGNYEFSISQYKFNFTNYTQIYCSAQYFKMNYPKN